MDDAPIQGCPGGTSMAVGSENPGEMAQLAGPRWWFALREGGPLWLSQPQFPPVLGRGAGGGAGGRWCGGPSPRGLSGLSAVTQPCFGLCWGGYSCSAADPDGGDGGPPPSEMGQPAVPATGVWQAPGPPPLTPSSGGLRGSEATGSCRACRAYRQALGAPWFLFPAPRPPELQQDCLLFGGQRTLLGLLASPALGPGSRAGPPSSFLPSFLGTETWLVGGAGLEPEQGRGTQSPPCSPK